MSKKSSQRGRDLAKNTICYINQSASYLDNDIIESFRTEGRSVILFTGSNMGNDLFNSDIRIVRLKSYNRKNTYTRFITWLVFTSQVAVCLLFKRKANMFFVSNPPFSVFIPYFLRLRNYVLLIWDIYPDILLNYGYISEKSLINKIWTKVNERVFSKAKAVFTLSNGMKEVILKYSNHAKVVINPLWADCAGFTQVDRKENFFAKKYGLEKSFVVMYSGNLGKTHDIEFIIDLAIIMRRYDTYRFVIIGDGYKKDLISKRIQQNSLTNCLLLPFQDTSVLPYSLSCADIGVVTLSSDASKYSVPSKIFNMMAAGVAFLAITDEDSELAAIVEEYKLGKSFNANQVDLMKVFLLELENDNGRLMTYKANSLRASKSFSKKNAEKYYEVWFS